MHQNRLRQAAGSSPRIPHLGSLQRSTDPQLDQGGLQTKNVHNILVTSLVSRECCASGVWHLYSGKM